jgi:hypothetical protein
MTSLTPRLTEKSPSPIVKRMPLDELVIPETVEGNPVTSIGELAFVIASTLGKSRYLTALSASEIRPSPHASTLRKSRFLTALSA